MNQGCKWVLIIRKGEKKPLKNSITHFYSVAELDICTHCTVRYSTVLYMDFSYWHMRLLSQYFKSRTFSEVNAWALRGHWRRLRKLLTLFTGHPTADLFSKLTTERFDILYITIVTETSVIDHKKYSPCLITNNFVIN